MTTNNPKSISPALDVCIAAVRKAKSLAGPLIRQLDEKTVSDEFLKQVHEFMDSFAAVKDSIDALPMENGVIKIQISQAEKREVEKVFPVLIKEIEILAEQQKLIIETLNKWLAQNTEQMKVIRDVKEVFQKFIKKPDQGPRFFDKSG